MDSAQTQVDTLQWSVLDSIFYDFITTNTLKGRNSDLSQLLDSERDYHAKFYKYSHQSVPYLATVQWVARGEKDILCIRLNHNGDIYGENGNGKVTVRRDCARHCFSDWIQFDETEVRKALPQLFSLTQKLRRDGQTAFPHTCDCVVYYHPHQQRVDIRLRSVVDRCPNLDICYEAGVPFEDPW